MWALVEDNTVTQVFRDARGFTFNDVQYPASVFTQWTVDERKALGIYNIETDQFPDTKAVSVNGSELTFDPDHEVVKETWITTPLTSDQIVANLTADIASALVSIDASAEGQRLLYITGGSGQALTYQEKYAQALLVTAQSTPMVKTDYPLVSNEIGITAPDTGDVTTDMKAVAAVIIQSYETWKVIGGMIEQVRLQAKKDVRACATSADVVTVLQNISWPHP